MICRPRVIPGNSTGAVLMRRQVAAGFIQDFDTIQGRSFVQHFFQMRPGRLVANVPLYFDLDQRLVNKNITCIELVNGNQTPTYAGVDIPTNFINAWLTLCDDCSNILVEIPISRINRGLNGGKNYFLRRLPIDWSKSYLTFNSVSGLSSSGFLFNIWTL